MAEGNNNNQQRALRDYFRIETELAQKFLTKFFPPSKTAHLRSEIVQFRQIDFEPLYEAWERFKELLRKCPQHGYEDWFQIQIFYNGRNGQTRTIIDAASGGMMLSKTYEEAELLLEEMASNNAQWPSERSSVKRAVGMHEIDLLVTFSAQISALTNKISELTAKEATSSKETAMVASTSYIGEGGAAEQVQHMNSRNFNYRSNNMPSNLPSQYHPGLQNHENFSYGNNKNVLQPPPGYSQPLSQSKPSIDDLLSTFIVETRGRFNKDEARLDNIETHCTNMSATVKTMETQIRQLADSMKSLSSGKFPSDTVKNPKE
ncbi:uncharacterized protein LOC112094221 [Morus notabilis]|uniref:uncharacterized protein LOC112094221 n=1 Tax=Morus notabilis TaxID=981085 RepID=UPI000CECFF0E|nr:uncharacterized protein LOC112094221 [Morus notabilis]